MARDHWRIQTVQELIDSGSLIGHQDGNHGSQYPRISEFGTTGVPFLTAKLVDDGRIDIEGAPRLPDESANKLRIGFTRPGDVLLSHNATIGRVAIVPEFHGRLLLGTSLTYFRVDPAKLSARYLAAYLAGPGFQAQLKAVMSHTTRNQVPVTAQRQLRIDVPPLAEQQAIAAVVAAFNEKIHLNRRMNETLEELSQTIFKSWFVDFDGCEDMLEAEDGGIPRAWRTSVLGDHLTLQRGTTYSGNLVGLPGPALLGLGAIEPGGGFRDGHYKTYGGECPEKLTLHPGDLFVALKGATKDGSMVGSVARVPPTVEAGRLTQDTVKLQIVNQTPGFDRYLYWLLRTTQYRTYCAGRITGCAQVGLSRDDFLAYPVPIPPPNMLAEFGQVESAFCARQDQANAESITLASLRDLLLPKLISGELRIKDAEKMAESVL